MNKNRKTQKMLARPKNHQKLLAVPFCKKRVLARPYIRRPLYFGQNGGFCSKSKL